LNSADKALRAPRTAAAVRPEEILPHRLRIASRRLTSPECVGRRESRRATFESDHELKALRDRLAKYIIEQARHGERDQRRVRYGALLQYAQSNLKSKPRK
jgi:phage-related minor tail protein